MADEKVINNVAAPVYDDEALAAEYKAKRQKQIEEDFQKPFDPPTRFIRIDPYDNQSGEVEYDDGSLAYNEVDNDRQVMESEELS